MAQSPSPGADDWVVMGRVSGLHGVRGWVKLFSYTAPREAIARYEPLYLQRAGQWQPLKIEESRTQGKGLVVKFQGIDERTQAEALLGCDLTVRRAQLPAPPPGEYYWADLLGLTVVTRDGVKLGVVDYLFETGANDVVVVRGERERLIPFLQGQVIEEIDLESRVMRVDWDPDF
ncbi:MAG: ribosome maturation factor RimM [Candidatus Competibacteraceae bacterium]|nr:ribosome maturation factor RimM [Candidatus Competibacteraceae bacterium]